MSLRHRGEKKGSGMKYLNFNVTKWHFYVEYKCKKKLLTFPMLFRYFESKNNFLCLQTAAFQALKN